VRNEYPGTTKPEGAINDDHELQYNDDYQVYLSKMTTLPTYSEKSHSPAAAAFRVVAYSSALVERVSIKALLCALYESRSRSCWPLQPRPNVQQLDDSLSDYSSVALNGHVTRP
jgi:hypothetical protein